MREPIPQCSGYRGIPEHGGPLRKRQIGSDQNTGVFVELGQQMKQQGTAGLAEWQVTQFIQNDQIRAHQAHGYATRLTLCLFLFQRIDQIHGGVKPHTL